MLSRFGRAYPPGWDAEGQPLHCLSEVEWLGADGQVLARSDAHDRATFLSFVAEHRTPRIAAHWAWLLQPLAADHSAAAQAPGALRYRQIEDHRMAKADAPMSRRLLLFGAVLLATAVLSVYTRVKSKRLPDFLDTPSNERLPVRTKLKAFAAVGRRGEDD